MARRDPPHCSSTIGVAGITPAGMAWVLRRALHSAPPWCALPTRLHTMSLIPTIRRWLRTRALPAIGLAPGVIAATRRITAGFPTEPGSKVCARVVPLWPSRFDPQWLDAASHARGTQRATVDHDDASLSGGDAPACVGPRRGGPSDGKRVKRAGLCWPDCPTDKPAICSAAAADWAGPVGNSCSSKMPKSGFEAYGYRCRDIVNRSLTIAMHCPVARHVLRSRFKGLSCGYIGKSAAFGRWRSSWRSWLA